MTADRPPAPALRPYLAADAPVCAAIFRAAIDELTVDYYGESQREAWATRSDDVAAFGARLAGALTLVATIDGGPVGFASLKDDVVDMLFVAPAAARRGIGTTLLDALSKLAAARGVKKLTGEVSDTALLAFEKQGFVAERRNIVRVGEEWLASTTMTKALASADPAKKSKLH